MQTNSLTGDGLFAKHNHRAGDVVSYYSGFRYNVSKGNSYYTKNMTLAQK